MAASTGAVSDLHALLIGCDCYLPNNIPNVGYYPSLSGCVRDIQHVEQFLLTRLNLAPERIIRLTSTDTGAQQPPEPPAQWPTYENMVAAFKQIVESAHTGDQVYIHYSGHGGRATTVYADLKGANGLDETLVPINIGNSEARYLRDIELSYLLQSMVDKGLVVTIVLDSCHSGGATRAALAATVRGVSWVDTSARPPDSLVASPGDLAANWQRQSSAGGTRSLEAAAGWLPEPQGYVLLAACRPNEFAYEYPFEGNESNGALTYWLLKSLATLSPTLTYQAIYDQVAARIHNQFAQQSPILAGDVTRTAFGSSRVQAPAAVDVLEVEAGTGRVHLAAGEAQGINQGARFAVYPAGTTDFGQVQTRLALVDISDVNATDSWGGMVAGVPRTGEIAPGAQAVLLTNTAVAVQRKVRMFQRDGLPEAADELGALQRVGAALQQGGMGFVVLAGPGQTPDYQVAVNAACEFEILDPGGNPIPLRPPLASADPAAATAVVSRLVKLARYRSVLELDNYDDLSPLAHRLTATLLGQQDSYQRGQRPDPQPFDSVTGGVPTLRAGQWTFLRIQNQSSQTLNVSVLDLSPDWGISQQYPRYEDYEPMDPGEERIIPMHANLPAGYSHGNDVLKIFGTLGPTSFRWLEMPALDQPQAAAATRGLPRNPLEEFLLALSQGNTRGLETGGAASEQWVVAQVTVQITA